MKFSKPKRRKYAMPGRRMNVEDDRISSLSDDLIHKILSFTSIDDAIKTSFLSTRWRYLWTSIPYLNFLNEKFCHGSSYLEFVVKALSRLNNQLQVSSFKLIDHTRFSPDLVKRIINYVDAYNVQELTIESYLVLPATWELSSLTTLHLHRITLSDRHFTMDHKCIDLISKCINLKNFTLSDFIIEEGTKVLDIFHPQLSTLTIKDTLSDVEVLNVVTPQLKDLTILTFSSAKYMISAPEITSLMLRGCESLDLSTELGFPFLEKVVLSMSRPILTATHKLLCLLQQFHTIKFLKVDLNILELLSSSTEQISHESCLFSKFKISNFSTRLNGKAYMEAQEKVVTTTTELKSQDTSPCTIFAMVSCEEIEVMSKLVLAEQLIKDCRLWEITCKRKVEVKMESLQDFEMQWHFGEIMAQIEQQKIDGLLTYKFPILETRNMISGLQCIAGLMIELPESKRPALEATFFSMCEEAAILINDRMDRMRKRPSRARKRKSNKVA